ncbi:hypothetical protein Pint_07087 [Pistacia integerrima]|uniref:Uncharacterized protein n=1 Tax=Pistacia integerrima TaxID=434235 RepID=A0ACC0XX44_9ROSI|nr:hypothetical protein Pint_07087 [Pistacia integerrima]
MQRSRRALLDRRAVEKASSGKKWNRVYQVSLSLVFVLWGLVLLLSLWISRGDGYRDGSAGLAGGISTWHEPKIEHNKHSGIVDKHPSQEIGSNHSKEGSCPSVAKTEKPRCQIHADEGDTNSLSAVMQPEVDMSNSALKSGDRFTKTDRISRAVPVGLDEFKSRAFSSKSKSGTGHHGGVKHRLEPGGTEYNYASASKGAKVLAYNKEAKGAANILSRDKDKYLKEPMFCRREFSLSDSYMDQSWQREFYCCKCEACARFPLEEPKWVRYLKLNLLSHYGSEFYCTLSVIEVYGVDAIERTLEDLISVQDDVFVPDEGTAHRKPPSSPQESLQSDDVYQNLYKELESDSSGENLDVKREIKKNTVPDPVEEIRHQVGRLPADTVLKILMQKAKHVDDLSSWKYLVSMQLETFLRDNAVLRLKVEQVMENQVSLEKKGIIVFVICIIFGFFALLRLFVDMLLSVFLALSVQTTEKSGKFCRDELILALLTCKQQYYPFNTIIIIVMAYQ